MSNAAPEQYPYEPPESRSRNPFFVIGAASAIVVLIFVLGLIVAVFALGTASDNDFICDERCVQATEISGTNFAVETQLAATQTATFPPIQTTEEATEATIPPVARTATALANAIQATQTTEPFGDDPTPTREGDTPISTELPQTGGGFPNILTYTAAEGDTVQSIAERFASSVNAIIAANGLSEAGLVFVGQELLIPVAAGTGVPLATPTTFLDDAPTQLPSSTTTPTPTPPPTNTAIPTEIAAIPVRVVVVGEEIGIGTIRLFAPEAADYPETVRIELALQLSQQVWTATPAPGSEDEPPPPGPPSDDAPSDSSTTSDDEPPPATTQGPTGTPSTTPNFEESGLAVFQRMGASLFCLESSFSGCDESSDPAQAELITDLERGIRWTWVIRPDENINGLQDLQVVLWRLVVADDGPQEADVVWSHFFQINANASDSGGVSAAVVGIAALGLLLLLVFAIRTRRSTPQAKARGVGPKVFISYRRHDTWAVARNLYDQLESRGARVFLDVKDINEGRFAEIIEKNIELCEYFIPVLSPETLNSTWVRREIATAIAHHKVIIPVLVSGFTFEAPLPDDIKELESHNSITLMPEYLDAAIARLLQFLHLSDT